MKVRVEIECTAEEARAFFGLPDVGPAQQAAMAGLQERLVEAMAASAPEDLMQAWMPSGTKGLEAMQNMFWAAAGGKPETKQD